ncbi:hypothetical protein H1R20_g10590, partial [Candolleomyces eurysporus]
MEPPENKVEATTLTSLPAEMLGEIFYHCSAFSPDAPLRLSLVSKSFHQVVHSTPNVWQRLSLKTNLVRDTGCAEEKATFWFSKVGSCLVDVKVEIVQSQSAVSGTTTPITHPSSHHLPLLGVLKAHVRHIRSLDVSSASELDARVFLNAIYEAPSSSTSTTAIQVGDDIISLESLSVSVSSTTPPNLRLSSSFVKFPLQILLPKLQSLSLTNHTIDFLVSYATTSTSTPSADSIIDPSTINADLSLKTSFGTGTFENLRYLSVICPIRFAPLPVSSVLTILWSSPRLEELVVESRIVSEGPSIGSDANPNSTSALAAAGGPPTPTSAVGPAPESSNSSEAEAANGGNVIESSLSIVSISSPSTPTAATTNTPTLVHLPHLTSLSLRTNAIPSILSQLLLPNLDRLHLEDLNGKRAGGSKETADVLRQVLVRMELPNAYHKKERSIGLRVLEVGGVDITVGGGVESGQIDRDAKTTWEWCFKRMVTLEELAVNKMSDPMSLFELFAPAPSPPSSSYPTSAFPGGFDGLYHHSTPSTPVCPSPVDTVCPLLRRFSITSTTCLLTSSDLRNRLIIERFRTTRSNVELDVEVVKDPFYQSMLTGPVDFLSLYSDMTVPRPTGTHESFAVKRGSTTRKPAAKSFGPWVVLN